MNEIAFILIITISAIFYIYILKKGKYKCVVEDCDEQVDIRGSMCDVCSESRQYSDVDYARYILRKERDEQREKEKEGKNELP